MNVLVLGGRGMLGKSLVKALTRAEASCISPSSQELDITDEIAVRKYITMVQPAYVINCAAETRVDFCEQAPARAGLVNGEAVGFMARATKKAKGKFIQISTDYVFNGENKGLVAEDDVTDPLQHYGISKRLGEVYALESGGSVVRVQWLFGDGKPNFIDWIAKSVLEKKRIDVSSIQSGCPTSVEFVSNLLVVSLQGFQSGVYHAAHENFCTRLECAKYIADYFGSDYRDCFNPIDHLNFGPALRPASVYLHSSKIKEISWIQTLGTWQSDVLIYLSSRYRNEAVSHRMSGL